MPCLSDLAAKAVRPMETGLKLLTREGAVEVKFRPRLSADQYTELLLRVNRVATKAELRRELEEAAKQWQRDLEFDK
jgi:hypothetical protein